MGRPCTLNQVARVIPSSGERLTRAQVVTRGLQLGLDVLDACTSAGIDKATYLNWKKAGAQAAAKIARGEKVTKAERDYAEFLTNCETAQVEFEEICLGVIHQAGDGGRKITETRTVTRRDKRGEQVVERVETTKTLLPQWQAKAWLLERRRPEKYRRRVEVTGADGKDLIPPKERADSLADSLEEMLRAQGAADEAEARAASATTPAFDGS